jgi:hypothetical protein
MYAVFVKLEIPASGHFERLKSLFSGKQDEIG